MTCEICSKNKPDSEFKTFRGSNKTKFKDKICKSCRREQMKLNKLARDKQKEKDRIEDENAYVKGMRLLGWK